MQLSIHSCCSFFTMSERQKKYIVRFPSRVSSLARTILWAGHARKVNFRCNCQSTHAVLSLLWASVKKNILCAFPRVYPLSHARSFGQVTQRFVLFCFVLFCFFSWRVLPFDTLRRQQKKIRTCLGLWKKIKTSLTVSRSIPVKSDCYYWLQHSATLISSGL